MKKVILLFIATFLVNIVNAQDKVFLKTGELLQVKVKSVTEDEIKYVEDKNKDQILYSVKKKNVFMIQYENGKNEFFNTKSKAKPKTKQLNYDHNLIHYHFFDVIFNDFTFSYERILKSGKVGIQVPLGLGYNTENFYAYGDYSNVFYSGIGANFYPTGQSLWSFFVGPSLRFGDGIYQNGRWNDERDEWISEKEHFFYSKFFVNLGMLLSPVENFSASVTGSLGIKYLGTSVDDYTPAGIYSSGHFAINLSYRF